METKINENISIVSESTKIATRAVRFVIETTHDDMWELMGKLYDWHIEDRMIYGYNPWDYSAEFELNLKYSQNLKMESEDN